MMDKEKKEKLERAGWRVGSTADFLGLSTEEEEIIELRLALSRGIKNRRLQSKMTQEKFAKQLGTSQSRLNKMEAGDPSVSFDLLIKGLVCSGVTIPEISELLVAK